MTIPYDRCKTLYNASSYLKAGISFEILNDTSINSGYISLLFKICHIVEIRSEIPARQFQ
jgi:hypothetical protein